MVNFNGDGTNSPYGYESDIGSASNLPYPDYPITNNIGQIMTNLAERKYLGGRNGSTTATAITFPETVNNFYFVEVRASWGASGGFTSSMLIPSDTWAQQNGGSDALKVFLNNTYSSTTYAEISKRTANGCTIALSNATINVDIRGVMRKVV